MNTSLYIQNLCHTFDLAELVIPGLVQIMVWSNVSEFNDENIREISSTTIVVSIGRSRKVTLPLYIIN